MLSCCQITSYSSTQHFQALSSDEAFVRTAKGVYALSSLAGISQRPTARNPRSQKKVLVRLYRPHDAEPLCQLTVSPSRLATASFE